MQIQSFIFNTVFILFRPCERWSKELKRSLIMYWWLANHGKLWGPGTCCGWSLRAVSTWADLAFRPPFLEHKSKDLKQRLSLKTTTTIKKPNKQKTKTKSDSFNNKKFCYRFWISVGYEFAGIMSFWTHRSVPGRSVCSLEQLLFLCSLMVPWNSFLDLKSFSQPTAYSGALSQ